MNECPNELLSGYLDGELPEADARAVEAHLAGCERCAGELASLRQLRELAGGLAAPPVADGQWAAAWATIHARTATVRLPRRASRAWRSVRIALVPVAAAALVALAVGFWALGPHHKAQAEQCVVELVESADGYASSYYQSDEGDVTIITLVPVEPEEASPSDANPDRR